MFQKNFQVVLLPNLTNSRSQYQLTRQQQMHCGNYCLCSEWDWW